MRVSINTSPHGDASGSILFILFPIGHLVLGHISHMSVNRRLVTVPWVGMCHYHRSDTDHRYLIGFVSGLEMFNVKPVKNS